MNTKKSNPVRQELNPASIFQKTGNLIIKEIEDELMIVTTSDDMTDINSAVYTVNPTGREVWEKIDGTLTLDAIIRTMTDEYKAPKQRIENDVRAIMGQFLDKRLIFEKPQHK